MRGAAAGLAVLAPVAAAGCESTQERSARLEREGGRALQGERGLRVAEINRAVRVVEARVLRDELGAAAVVELENTSGRAMADVPVAIDVRGARGRSLYRNDEAGLEPALTSAPLLPPGRRVAWVHNQVVVDAAPERVVVRVGGARGSAPDAAPAIEVGDLRRDRDVDGPYVAGTVANRSRVVQRRLTVFCVTRRSGRIVAAGRAIVDRLPPTTGRPARFTVFFVGDPTEGRLVCSAPPTTLR